MVEDRPPELAMYFIFAFNFFKLGKIVALVKLPAPIIPITPLLSLKDLLLIVTDLYNYQFKFT